MKILYFLLSLTSIFGSFSASAARNPRIGLNFLAQNAQNCRATVLASPQNPTAAVGPTQFISSTYQTLRSFDKSTGEPDGVLDIDSAAFVGVLPFPSSFTANDIWLVYHTFLKRWIYSYESNRPSEVTGPTTLNFVASDAAIITDKTTWSHTEIPASQINPIGGGTPAFLDFEQPAFDANAWYNGVGTFSDTGAFIGSSLTVVPNSSIAAGNPHVTVFPGLFPQTLLFFSEGFAAPATNYDPNPEFGYFVWTTYNPSGIEGNTIGLYRILNAGTNTPTLGPLVSITVPTYAYHFILADHKNNLFGDLGRIQTGVGRINSYMHVRHKQLFLCQDIQIDSSGNANTSGDRVGIRWYQFDLTGDPTGKGKGTETESTVPVLIQHGTLFDSSPTNPLFYYLGTLMTNKKADMVISFNTSGVNSFINTGYAFRSASDPLGTLRPPVTITNSQFPYNFDPNVPSAPGPNIQRFGDQSAAVPDPENDDVFWLSQPFAALQNAWGIQATQIIVS